MKKSWDWLIILALLIYSLQLLAVPLKLFSNSMAAYFVLFGILFLLYFIYSFYYIFKINRDKEKPWKIQRTLRSISFLLVFIGICLYFMSHSIDMRIRNLADEVLKGSGESDDLIHEVVKNTGVYSFYAFSVLGLGIIGLLTFWNEPSKPQGW